MKNCADPVREMTETFTFNLYLDVERFSVFTVDSVSIYLEYTFLKVFGLNVVANSSM